MSFASRLMIQKNKLKCCQTVVTSATGTKYIETKNDLGELEQKLLLEKSPGFVVDERLDLNIAEILEFLFLSSQDVAQDENLLLKYGITHVLSLGVNLSHLPSHSGIMFEKIDLLDEPNANLEEVLQKCYEFIECIKTENSTNKILVHCNAGYSRAPTVIIFYLMKKFGHSLIDAYNLVKKKRNIKPNEGFMKQLLQFERELNLRKN